MTGYEHQCEKFSSAFFMSDDDWGELCWVRQENFAVEILYREKTNNDRAFKVSTKQNIRFIIIKYVC